ncbi:serine/threonine protein kinase [Psychromonas sp. PT13]|uniref:serine/threonine protein kinase n=1 Tax=Psychromonas sp. PT13 TaxID=3439547 RepID=UPI003EBC983F
MSDDNFSYLSLTPEVQLDALATIGIYPETGLTALNSYENRVFLFTDENKIRYVVKFYRPNRWNKSQLQEEHAFCLALHQESCPIAPPVVINGETLFFFEGYYFALFNSLSARTMEPDNIDLLYDVGQALGKIHHIGAQQSFHHREHLDVQTMLISPIKELHQSKLIPTFIREPFFASLSTLENKIIEHYDGNIPMICLHGDCHTSNILINKDEPFFVDFDDCKMGPAVQDLWMLLNGDKAEKQLQLSMLLEGYQEEHDFNNKELALIEPLRSMRMINYVNWINKRWTDPAFPMNFPWFTSDQYWKELLQSLNQQITAMDDNPLTLQPNY